MRRTWRRVLLGLLGATLLAWGLQEARVIVRDARIRESQKKFGKTLLQLGEGDAVTILSEDAPWLRVRRGDVEGWLHESAITRDRNYVFSGSGVGVDVEASERSAAQKGFDEMTERDFRASRPQLEQAFRLVDRIDADAPDETAVASFVDAGALVPGGAR